MNKSPKKEELLQYANNIKEASIKFNVSERTIRRWLKLHNIYYPKSNYNPNKLTTEQVVEIREKYNAGHNQQKIANEFKVSQATIANIINYKTHKFNITLNGSFPAKYSANFIIH